MDGYFNPLMRMKVWEETVTGLEDCCEGEGEGEGEE